MPRLHMITCEKDGDACTAFAERFDMRLVLAASDMQAALKIALEAISAVPNYQVPGHIGGSYAIASLIEQALTKAKGE